MSRIHSIQDWPVFAREAGYRATRLAKDCGVSLRQLERFFQKKTGQTPQNWLNSLRQREAIVLVIQGKSIKEVAYDLGYKQVSHFSREFKRAHGIAPSGARLRSDVASRYEMSPIDTRAQLNDERCRVLLSDMWRFARTIYSSCDQAALAQVNFISEANFEA